MKKVHLLAIIFLSFYLLFSLSCTTNQINKQNAIIINEETLPSNNEQLSSIIEDINEESDAPFINDETGTYQNNGVPILIIETEDRSPIVEKKIYLDATIKLINAPSDFNFDFTKALVRGRGNTSWTHFDKKPYRIKFDKRREMFGSSYKAKSWTLIANHSDKTLIRNKLAYDLSKEMGTLIYAPMTEMVELYLNGEYRGVYMFCDHNQVNEGRIAIAEPKKDYEGNYEDLGFFMEWNWITRIVDEVENHEWFFVFGSDERLFEIKSPDPDDFEDMSPFIDYIKPIIETVNASIESRNFAEIEKLIDIDSFIDYFLVQELFKNVDSGFASVHCYKKENDPKIYMGAVWDFDIAAGNAEHVDYEAEGFYTETRNPWFSSLMRTAEFREKYLARWYQVYSTILPDFFESILEIGEKNKAAVQHNFERWPILGTYVWPNPKEIVAIDTYEGQIEYLYNYLIIRATWLNENY